MTICVATEPPHSSQCESIQVARHEFSNPPPLSVPGSVPPPQIRKHLPAVLIADWNRRCIEPTGVLAALDCDD